MKKVEEYSVTDHGVENDQYFQGDGVSFTEFTDCATGIGNNPVEAFEDALEQLAQGGWDVEAIRLPGDLSEKSDIPPEEDDDGCMEQALYHRVTVKVR